MGKQGVGKRASAEQLGDVPQANCRNTALEQVKSCAKASESRGGAHHVVLARHSSMRRTKRRMSSRNLSSRRRSMPNHSRRIVATKHEKKVKADCGLGPSGAKGIRGAMRFGERRDLSIGLRLDIGGMRDNTGRVRSPEVPTRGGLGVRCKNTVVAPPALPQPPTSPLQTPAVNYRITVACLYDRITSQCHVWQVAAAWACGGTGASPPQVAGSGWKTAGQRAQPVWAGNQPSANAHRSNATLLFHSALWLSHSVTGGAGPNHRGGGRKFTCTGALSECQKQ